MRLARRAMVTGLAVLALCAAAPGQKAPQRNKQAQKPPPNRPPDVTLSASVGTLMQPCTLGKIPRPCTPSSDQTVTLTANASDPDGDTLLYTYSTAAGRISGEGPRVYWDLAGVLPGTYKATVEVDDANGGLTYSSVSVIVRVCDCEPICPTISISCPTDPLGPGTPATVSVNLSGGDPSLSVTYNWTVSAGNITGGQGTPTITVDTAALGNQTVTATVELGGLPPECDRVRSCSFSTLNIIDDIPCLKFDEYENLSFRDETRRLDNFAAELRRGDGWKGYYFIFGSCEQEGEVRSARAVDYLVKRRGVERGRVSLFHGGCRETLTTELWLCVPAAGRPDPTNMATVSPCPRCKGKVTSGRRRARRRG